MQKELFNRLIGALVFVFVWLVFVYFLDRHWFNGLVLAILGVTYFEWCRLCGVRSNKAQALLWLIFTGLGVASYVALDKLELQNDALYHTLIWSVAGALSTVWLLISLTLVYLVRRNIAFSRAYLSDISPTSRIALLVIGILLILPCLWFTDFVYSQEEIGRRLLMFFIGICIMMDVMAFFSGKSFGRHRLCPQISANKTIEGAIGGIFAASLWVVTGWFNYFQSLFPPIFILSMIVVIIAAVAGDMFESLLKRLSQTKDSGTIVYGHGGMYDRVDSFLAGSPVFVFVVCFFL